MSDANQDAKQDTEHGEAARNAARIVGGPPRVGEYVLQWPVECDGVVYERITLKRMSVGDMAAWLKASKDADENNKPPLPIYCDASGAPLPPAVLDALDVDDDEALGEAAESFMPRRFRDAQAKNSAPETGANSASS